MYRVQRRYIIFVLIDPDGTILARNYTNAFYQAKKILDKELGGTAAE